MHHSSISEILDFATLTATVDVPTSSPSQPRKVEAEQQKSSGKLFHLSSRTSSLLGVQIVSVGAYAPETVVTNQDLEERYGYEPGWIEQRTGILQRRYARPDQATSDLAIEAAKRAMRSAGVEASEIDLLIVGTFTPDYHCPSTACLVQNRLGLDCPAFDIQAACSGFVYSLVTAAQYVATGNAKRALVIGADTNSRIVNPGDQRTAPLFGDGAGAVIVTRGEPHQGLVCYQMGADGSGGPLLEIPSGGTKNRPKPGDIEAGKNCLHMDGRSVFKWAVQALTETIDLVLAKSGMSVHDVTHYLIHQANMRIIDKAAEHLGLPPGKIVANLQRYGNTSAASVPLALDEVFSEGKISRGDTLLFCGFGAGLTWGTSLFRW